MIAFDRGSIPEIIEDGLTGFVVKDKEQAVIIAERLSRLSRGAIRKRFEERFTARRMACEYLMVYRSLIEKGAYRQLRDGVRTTLVNPAPSIAANFVETSTQRTFAAK